MILIASAFATKETLKINKIEQDESIVTVQNGQLRGTVYDSYREFLGVPYMQQPVGNLRFADPLPAQNWQGVLNATQFLPGCPQPCHLPPGIIDLIFKSRIFFNLFFLFYFF